MQFPVPQKVPSLQLIANTPPNDEHQREALQRQNRLQLAALLRATEEMLICAQQGDWESVEELEHARKQDLVVSFENNAIRAFVYLRTLLNVTPRNFPQP